MEIIKTQERGVITLIIKGKIDTTTYQIVEQAINNAFKEAKDIVLDFREVEYISSAGLKVILIIQKSLHDIDATMKIKNASPEVKEVFEMTGFTDFMTIT
jgi:anti-sigma B factor antagonist